ncbi:MAG: ABC transporter permease [Erysipelotrichaceae bacterium]|nr:ABC transporter permease [Erysipelotrichaceae bacterium]
MENNNIPVEETVTDEIDMNDPSLFEMAIADDSESEHITAPVYSYWGSVFRRFFSSKIAIAMMIVAATIILFAFIQPMFSNYSPMVAPNINNKSMHYIRPFKMAGYPFGTDDVGNSLFDALWAGTKNSLIIALVSTLICEVVGIIVGMFWGFSKKVDAVMIEVYNVLSNIPTTLIAMILVYTMGGGFAQLIFALCVTSWIGTAYFIRVQVMIIRDREYNLASQCLGTPTWKIIINNIFPYLISVIITSVSRDVPSFISYEVALSFMGVGISQEYASLGRMVQKYAAYMTTASYLFWIPVATSAVICVSLYIVGQVLADASDPRTHMV